MITLTSLNSRADRGYQRLFDTWSMYPAIQVSLQTECEVFCRIVIKSPFPPAGVDHRSGADETLQKVVLRHRVDRGKVAAPLHKLRLPGRG